MKEVENITLHYKKTLWKNLLKFCSRENLRFNSDREFAKVKLFIDKVLWYFYLDNKIWCSDDDMYSIYPGQENFTVEEWVKNAQFYLGYLVHHRELDKSDPLFN